MFFFLFNFLHPTAHQTFKLIIWIMCAAPRLVNEQVNNAIWNHNKLQIWYSCRDWHIYRCTFRIIPALIQPSLFNLQFSLGSIASGNYSVGEKEIFFICKMIDWVWVSELVAGLSVFEWLRLIKISNYRKKRFSRPEAGGGVMRIKNYGNIDICILHDD